jgi:hypothetical protein
MEITAILATRIKIRTRIRIRAITVTMGTMGIMETTGTRTTKRRISHSNIKRQA